jgi:alginate production protein
LAAYTIRRDDLTKKEGRPLHIGMRALGAPSDHFNYWAELAFVRGTDESSRKFSGHGFDVGFTYRFAVPALSPSVTLGYAFGTGDGNPDDSRNREFRQSGLQSNEEKFTGVAEFKYYGEALDPELSNLKIFTVGFGFRPARNVTVDLVYHRYRLDKIADAIRNSALTALMNLDDARPSKDVGSAFDIVLGIRRLFGVRRLGVDLRAGWFYPGDAFRIAEGDPGDPMFRPANKGIGVVAKFWY